MKRTLQYKYLRIMIEYAITQGNICGKREEDNEKIIIHVKYYFISGSMCYRL